MTPPHPPTSVAAALAALEHHWAAYWPGADLGTVAADVRARLRDAARGWGLERVEPLAGGHVALVCAAERAGRAVVVKVQPRGGHDAEELLAEADALSSWEGTGAAVPLLERRDGGATLLLARLTPGTALEGSGLSYGERLEVLGGLAGRLHAAGTAPPAAPDLSSWSRGWRRHLARDPAVLALLDQLERTPGEEVLVHGDLHGGNALDDAGTWRVIDPKGLRTDRHVDVWALVDPSVPDLPAGEEEATAAATARVERYAQAAGLEPHRAGAWVVVRARAQALAVDARAGAGAADRAWAVQLHRLTDALTAPGRGRAYLRA